LPLLRCVNPVEPDLVLLLVGVEDDDCVAVGDGHHSGTKCVRLCASGEENEKDRTKLSHADRLLGQVEEEVVTVVAPMWVHSQLIRTRRSLGRLRFAFRATPFVRVGRIRRPHFLIFRFVHRSKLLDDFSEGFNVVGQA